MHPWIKMFHCLLLINTSYSYVSKEAACRASLCTDSASTSAMFIQQDCKSSFTSNPKQCHTGKADSVSQVDWRRFQKGWKHQSSAFIYVSRLSSRDQQQRESPCKSIYLSQTQRELLQITLSLLHQSEMEILTPFKLSTVATQHLFFPHNTSLISRQPDHKYEWVQTAQLFVGLFHVLCNIL